MTLPSICPSKKSFSGRVNLTQPLNYCPQEEEEEKVWAGELLSTKKSSKELVNCWMFPCFVIRKHSPLQGLSL